jgi:arylsulfatase A-like enzyme
MRVPFIAAWAKRNEKAGEQKRLGIPAGKVQEQVASVEDLFPTILELIGAEKPEGHPVDGKSLGVLLTGKKDEGRKEQFLMHYPHGPHRSNYFTVWRDGNWKLIYHTLPEQKTTGGRVQFGGGNYELYNLANDPFEQRDLATVKSRLIREMTSEMLAQLEKRGAHYPVDGAGRELKPRVPEEN